MYGSLLEEDILYIRCAINTTQCTAPRAKLLHPWVVSGNIPRGWRVSYGGKAKLMHLLPQWSPTICNLIIHKLWCVDNWIRLWNKAIWVCSGLRKNGPLLKVEGDRKRRWQLADQGERLIRGQLGKGDCGKVNNRVLVASGVSNTWKQTSWNLD